ncbi:MAG: hypothetical protein ACJ70U_07720 [Nitrososphaera sp.]
MVQAVYEVGIDISSQKSKIITHDMIKASAKSVNMGCIERGMSNALLKQRNRLGILPVGARSCCSPSTLYLADATALLFL